MVKINGANEIIEPKINKKKTIIIKLYYILDS